LEKLSEAGLIDLFYGDESRVSSEGNVSYGWQFPDEQVCVYVEKAYKVNIWGLISRTSTCHWAMTVKNINAQFVMEQLESLSLTIKIETFIVLDNASFHHAGLFRDRLPILQQRGLFLFFLPTYSPDLNLAETMWRKLKMEWLVAEDYLERDSLLYAVNRCMANVGTNLKIKFGKFNAN
jgi:hypothetical protein